MELDLMKIKKQRIHSSFSTQKTYQEKIEKLNKQRDPDGLEKAKKVEFSDMIVMDDLGKVLFIKRSKQAKLFPEAYGLPGGHIDPEDDTPKDAACRELYEETCLRFDNVASVRKIKNGDRTTSHYFAADFKADQIITLDNNEHINYVWLLPSEFDTVDMIYDLGDRVKSMYWDARTKSAMNNLVGE